MPAKVDNAKCEGCGDCVETCPNDVIKMENEKAQIKEEDCIDCAACVDACTHGALAMD